MMSGYKPPAHTTCCWWQASSLFMVEICITQVAIVCRRMFILVAWSIAYLMSIIFQRCCMCGESMNRWVDRCSSPSSRLNFQCGIGRKFEFLYQATNVFESDLQNKQSITATGTLPWENSGLFVDWWCEVKPVNPSKDFSLPPPSTCGVQKGFVHIDHTIYDLTLTTCSLSNRGSCKTDPV